jgi:ligand-binding SRPBCC domain-containing protein
MKRGAFRMFVHDHHFESDGTRTKMIDDLAFSAPFGILGRIAERLVLRAYLERMLASRAKILKEVLEEG